MCSLRLGGKRARVGRCNIVFGFVRFRYFAVKWIKKTAHAVFLLALVVRRLAIHQQVVSASYANYNASDKCKL